jgi:hypothetical protein
MKKLVIAVVVIVVGLLAYNYATTGELKLVPSFSVSEEEQGVQDLQDRFDAAKKQYAQAHRGAAVAGIDTTAEADAARNNVKKINRELKKLREGLTEERAIRKADALAGSVQAFVSELR